MQRMHRAVINRTVAGLVLALAAAGQASSQGEATTIPISRDLVELAVSVGTAPETRIRVLNGGMAIITLADGFKFGLVPVVKKTGLKLTMARITQGRRLSDKRTSHRRR